MASEQEKARQMLRDAIGGDGKSSRKLTPIPYPTGGVSETYAFSDQEIGTSRDEKNMRAFDPHTGRLRGSQRAGLGKYGDGVALTTEKVGMLASVTREINPYIWAAANSKEFAVTPQSGSSHCTDIARDSFGTYYILGSRGDLHITNEDGVELDRIDAPIWEDEITGSDNPLLAQTVTVDDFQNVFVATGGASGNLSELRCVISCHEHKADGTWGRVWNLYPNMFVLDMAIYGADLFVWGYTIENGSPWKHRYYLKRYPEYQFDSSPVADANSEWDSTLLTITPAGQANDDFVGRMVVDDDGTVYATASRYTHVTGIFPTILKHAGVWKLQPISPTASDAVWEYMYNQQDENTYNNQAGTTSANAVVNVQGFGHGVALGPRVPDTDALNGGARKLWLWGGGNDSDGGTNPVINNDIQPRVRLIIDTLAGGLGFDAQVTGSVPLQETRVYNNNAGASSQRAPGFAYRQLNSRGAVDEEGRLYLANGLQGTTGTSYSASHLHGRALAIFSPSVSHGTLIATSFTPAALGQSSGLDEQTCIAMPPLHPTYQDTSTPTTTDFLVMGMKRGDTPATFASGFRLVAGTIGVDSVREIKTIALSNRKYYRLDTNSAGSAVLITDPDAAAILSSANSEYAQAATGNGHIYITDGETYLDFNPQDNFLHPLKSEGYGEIPKRARLMEFWRGRLVIARTDNLPGTWHMSRGGDVHDWDQYPQTPDAQQAVSGTTAPAGKCPDSINAIVPYSDDLLWFGCDSSIWQMTGDPTTATFDMITDEVGMSWGRPYCKDDVGVLWFFGSKGGLYTYDNGLTDVARGKIRRRLRDIDLGANYIRLVYNHADDGIHIFVCPFGASSAEPRDHFFYDRRTASFHIDKFGKSSSYCEPTAAIVIDGDSGDDRAVLIGTGNGHITKWGRGVAGAIPKSDRLSNSADVAIDSYVLIGPIADVHDMSEAALSELAVVLAPNYSGVHIEVFATDTPDNLGDPVWHGEIHAGRNANQLVRVSGDSIYIRMRNATLGENWSLEKCSAILSYGGQIRSDT
jgi:hypothetical protein